MHSLMTVHSSKQHNVITRRGRRPKNHSAAALEPCFCKRCQARSESGAPATAVRLSSFNWTMHALQQSVTYRVSSFQHRVCCNKESAAVGSLNACGIAGRVGQAAMLIQHFISAACLPWLCLCLRTSWTRPWTHAWPCMQPAQHAFCICMREPGNYAPRCMHV